MSRYLLKTGTVQIVYGSTKRPINLSCPNALALHEKEHRSYPAVGHLSYIIPLLGQKDSPFSYQKQQHPAGISLIVRLKMVFQSMFYD